MGRRGRKAAGQDVGVECTVAREALERRWRGELIAEPRLSAMVTATRGHLEPFHRWLHYRQGFSPGLVRLFLDEVVDSLSTRGADRLVCLDPFAGSGTTLVECARRNVAALGVDATAALSFLQEVKTARIMPPLPELADAQTWQAIAERIDAAPHRAALMLAVARQCTATGQPNRGAKPLRSVLNDVVEMMREDLSTALPRHNPLHLDDARQLNSIEDESVDAIITSPPYVSGHDYHRITKPYETVYRFFCQRDGFVPATIDQIRACKRTSGVPVGPSRQHAAVDEICNALHQKNEEKLARLVGCYFDDLFAVLRACWRTLKPGGVFWLIVGGARVRGVHVPSDIIAAELASSRGFDVVAIRVARDVISARRKFGHVGHLSPRESLLVLRKP